MTAIQGKTIKYLERGKAKNYALKQQAKLRE